MKLIKVFAIIGVTLIILGGCYKDEKISEENRIKITNEKNETSQPTLEKNETAQPTSEKIETTQPTLEKNKDKIITDEDINNKLFFNKPDDSNGLEIVIYKEKRILELVRKDYVFGRFQVALGRNAIGDKKIEGDSKTPEGKYYICTRNNTSRFHKFMGVSYPNTEDAQIALNDEIISKSIFNRIKIAEQNKAAPDWNTPLGGEVGIHGGGAEYDWTLGCIALSNQDIDILWQYTKMKTPVTIYK